MDQPQDLLFQEVPVRFEQRNGWIRFFTDPQFFSHPQLSVCLCGVLTQWFQQHPHLHLRCVMPFNKGGDTTELHAWYDLHVFPPAAKS